MPKIVDHDQRRQQLARTVWELILDGGLGAVTIRATAAAAGVSIGQIQHYFPTREHLVVQSAELFVNVATATDPFDDPWQEVAARLEAVIPREDRSAPGAIIHQAYLLAARNEPEVRRVLEAAYRRSAEEMERLLNEVGVIDPRRDATLLLAMADGLGLQVQLGAIAEESARGLLDTQVAQVRTRVSS